MLFKKATTFLTISFICLFSTTQVILGAEQDNKATRAFQLFDEQNYTEAEPIFKNLIDEKPELLLLYYYYGACRTENQKYSEYDLIQLLNANPKEVPQKVNYYLGIQYQALNKWEQAIKYYNIFRLNSTVEEQSDLKLAEKIQECYNHENPYANLVIKQEDLLILVNPSQIDSVSDVSIQIPEVVDFTEEVENISDSLEENSVDDFQTILEIQPEFPIKIEETKKIKTIEFRVNSQICYYSHDEFKTEEGKSFFEKGDEKQDELNSTLFKIEELRNEYQLSKSTAEKDSIGQQILPLETETYSLKEEITQLFLQAENAENNFWKEASENEIEDFIKKQENFVEEMPEKTEKQNLIVESNITNVIDPAILFHSETETKFDNKPKTDELIYKIQIGAYSRGLPAYVDRLFKKLAVLRKIENYTDDRGVVVYTTGNLTNLEDAIKMQKQVRQEGAEDAYVVPYFNGKRITLEEAKKIEDNL